MLADSLLVLWEPVQSVYGVQSPPCTSVSLSSALSASVFSLFCGVHYHVLFIGLRSRGRCGFSSFLVGHMVMSSLVHVPSPLSLPAQRTSGANVQRGVPPATAPAVAGALSTLLPASLAAVPAAVTNPPEQVVAVVAPPVSEASVSEVAAATEATLPRVPDSSSHVSDKDDASWNWVSWHNTWQPACAAATSAAYAGSWTPDQTQALVAQAQAALHQATRASLAARPKPTKRRREPAKAPAASGAVPAVGGSSTPPLVVAEAVAPPPPGGVGAPTPNPFAPNRLPTKAAPAPLKSTPTALASAAADVPVSAPVGADEGQAQIAATTARAEARLAAVRQRVVTAFGGPVLPPAKPIHAMGAETAQALASESESPSCRTPPPQSALAPESTKTREGRPRSRRHRRRRSSSSGRSRRHRFRSHLRKRDAELDREVSELKAQLADETTRNDTLKSDVKDLAKCSYQVGVSVAELVKFAADTEAALNTRFQKLQDAENLCRKLRHAALSTQTTFQGNFLRGVTRSPFNGDSVREPQTALTKAVNSALQNIHPKCPVAAKSAFPARSSASTKRSDKRDAHDAGSAA